MNGRRFRLDLAFEDERVGVELDGRGYHANAADWEHDIARDRLLATAGRQTVRFSHARLMSDPKGCRRELLAILRVRREHHHSGGR